MYIARRTGGGRGVYEIAGQTSDGVSPSDIIDRELILKLQPYLDIRLGLKLKIQGGKPRLVRDSPQIVQIQRQIAALLLLPKPIRADSGLGTNPDVAITDAYAIEKISIQRGLRSQHYFEFIPNGLTLKNSHHSLQFSLVARFTKVVSTWQNKDKFPVPIRDLLAEHERLINQRNPIDKTVEEIVAKLQQESATYAQSIDLHYLPQTDVFKVLDNLVPVYTTPSPQEEALADEIDLRITPQYEGAKRQITVNAYERNPAARKQCIAYYGSSCLVCDINFERVYGSLGKDYIHVHHLKPLSEIGEQYLVDPIVDLRPVCPNCHAILHKRNPPYTIEELKDIIAGNRAE
jgi:predicted HNH restriction endonuclease